MRGHCSGLEADHLADHLHRDLRGDVLHELALTPVDHDRPSTTAAARRSISSTSMRDHPGREGLGHQSTVPGCACGGSMLRMDRRSWARDSSSWVGDEGAAELAGERLPVVADRPHVCVSGERPRSRGRRARGASTPAPHAAAGRTGRGGHHGPRSSASRSMPSRSSVMVIECSSPRGRSRSPTATGARSTACSSVIAPGSMRRIISSPNSRPMTAGPTSLGPSGPRCRLPRSIPCQAPR